MDDLCVRYEPLPRWGHVSVPLGDKVFMWGGRTEDFSEAQRKKLATSVEVFDFKTETWVTRNTSGPHPQGLYNCAYALQGTNLYVYGGWDGQKAHNVLHQLNLKTFAWSEVKVGNPDDAPPEMSGCGIVAYGDNKLVLFGGYGQKKEKKKKVKKVVKKKTTTSNKDTTGEHKVEMEVDKTENVSTDKDGDNLGVEHGSQEGAKNGVDQERVTNGTAESEATESGKELGQNGTESEETIKSKGGVESGKDGIEGAVGGTANGADKGTEGEKKEERKKLPKKVSFKKQEVATQEEVTVEVHSDGDPAKEGHSQDDQNGDKKVQNGEGEENGAPKPVEEGESVKEEEEEEEETSANFLFYKRNDSDKKGWTNEVKVFDISTGIWTSQPTTGSVPPPCVDFSFTCVDKRRAVVFGGYQPQTGITNDTFLLDMDTWMWTKLSGPEGALSFSTPSPHLHPSARDGHAACVVEGEPRPLMLVTGGWDAMDHALNDVWVLDITSGLWSQLTVGEKVACRFWHTAVASQSSSRMRQWLMFGGCPGAPESHTTGSWPKMADTFIMEMGKVPSLPLELTEDTLMEEKWVVVNTVSNDQLGHPMQRLQEAVILASFRAQRAEDLLREMTRRVKQEVVSKPKQKLPSSHIREVVTEPKSPSSLIQDVVTEQKLQSSLVQEVLTEEEEEEEEEEVVEEVELPFWQKSMNEIHITHEEVGRGRFSVVKVAIFHETQVAARCLFNRIASEENRKIFTNCLEMASQLRHPNLVSFMGAVLDGEPVIITELMHCNLRSVLEKNPLTYYQLVDVATCVAKALEYLHTVKPEPVIHGELTGTSVLLEGNKGPRLKAKLSDYMTAKYFHHLMSSLTPTNSMEDVFGMSREHPSQEYKVLRRSRSRSGSPFDAVRNSPDRTVRSGGKFMRKISASTSSAGPSDVGGFSTKRDVYLFGILLVEMATRTAVLEVSLQYLIESIAWPQVTALVKKCLVSEPDQRPAMDSVLSQVIQLASFKP